MAKEESRLFCLCGSLTACIQACPLETKVQSCGAAAAAVAALYGGEEMHACSSDKEEVIDEDGREKVRGRSKIKSKEGKSKKKAESSNHKSMSSSSTSWEDNGQAPKLSVA